MTTAPTPRLIAITDPGRATLAEHVAAYQALAARLPRGALAVQLRAPGEPVRLWLGWGEVLRRVTDAAGGLLVVNDRLDVALAIGAHAVHLGERSVRPEDARALLGDDAWVSRAVHDPAAALGPCDAALLSPIFASPGKGPPLGLPALRAFCAARSGVAVYALGGVDAGHVRACLEAGAAGVAVIRAALDASQHGALARALGGDAS